MGTRFWQEELECMPMPEVPAFHDGKLRQSRLISRAFGSALYSTAWQKAGLTPESIRSRIDLQRVPYLTGSSLKDAFAEYAVDDILTSQNVRFWFCTSGTTGTPKWIPYTDADVSLCEQLILRGLWLCGGDRIRGTGFGLTTPAPFVANGSAYMGIFAEMVGGLRNERVTALATEVDISLPLARARKAIAFSAFPSVAARIAERLSEVAQNEASRQFKESKTMGSFMAMLLARFKRIRFRDIMKFRYGLFSGESLAPYRQAIADQYGLEPYELYASTEFLCFHVECPHHCGLHFWLDTCIGEIIPLAELEKEENTPGHTPQAQFLDQVPAGTVGEYVLTTFSEALPLVRYRTSDLIEIVGTGRCRCQRTHPRVKILRRLDDVVNLGLIRFTIPEIEACLGLVSRAGRVTTWQLRLEREGYKPQPVFLVEAARSGTEQELLGEITTRIFEGIEVLKVGCEKGIVASPVIRLVDKVEEVRTATGKVKRIVYGKTW